MVFNVFIWMQWFNMYNARKIDDERDIGQGLRDSSTFLYISGGIGFVQLLIMQTPIGNVFKVESQTFGEWVSALMLGIGCVIVSQLLRQSDIEERVNLPIRCVERNEKEGREPELELTYLRILFAFFSQR